MKIDWIILQWIQNNLTCVALDFLMPKVTQIANVGTIWLVIAIMMICSKKWRVQGCFLLAGIAAGAVICNLGLKLLIARPRPCWIDSSVPLLIAMPRDFSFPSGHALCSTISATFLTMTKRKVGFVVIPLAVLISFSRLYLYVHFPSDILGGVLLGLAVGIGTYYTEQKMKF